jgi:hypothetical protein
MDPITLKRPIALLDKTSCTHVRLRRDYLTAGDILAMRRAGADEVVQSYALAARLFGLDMMEFDSLEVSDAAKLVDVVNRIANPGGETDPKDETPSGTSGS